MKPYVRPHTETEPPMLVATEIGQFPVTREHAINTIIDLLTWLRDDPALKRGDPNRVTDQDGG